MSREVSRQRRGYPCRAPFGYVNDYRTHGIAVVPEEAALVKQAYELYATGMTKLDTLRQFFAENKIKSVNGKLVGRSFVSHILSNPIYYGHFQYGGEIHEGKHKPIITKKVFDEVQAILNRRWRYSPGDEQKEPKAFLGLLHCAGCGGAITAEIQKGHTYYRCTKKSRATIWCHQPYIREEALDAEITSLLKPFSLRADWADEMLTRLKEDKKQSAQSAALVVAGKRQEIEKINLRLQKLLDSFLDGVIERNEYTAEKAKLMSHKRSLEEHSSALSAGRADWLEPFQNWILTAKNAGEIAVSGSLQEKRVLAQQVFGSNLVLDCKKARGCSVKPWSLLVEKSQTGGMVGWAGLEPATNGLKGRCSTD